MKTQKTRRAGYLALAIGLTGLFAVAPAASAQYGTNSQYPNGRNYRGRAMASRSYDRMRQYAQQLDEQAREARRQAHMSQSPYRTFGRDTKFLREIDQFSARATQFRVGMETYQTRPWNVDDEIAGLLQDARNVEARLQRARFVDRRTVSNWNRTVALLNQMTTEYQAGIGYRNRYPNGTYRGDQYPNGVDPNAGVNPNTVDPRTDPYPGNNGDYRGDRNPDWNRDRNPNNGSYANSTDLRQLAAELDQRAARASQLSSGYTGYSSDLRQFSEQARNFRDQVESNQMSRTELRTEVNQLLSEAQNAYSELQQRNVSRQVADEWSAIVQILNRMRDLAV